MNLEPVAQLAVLPPAPPRASFNSLDSSLLHVAEGRRERYIKVAVIHKDAVVDDGLWLECLELLIGVEGSWPKLISSKHAGAHKYRAVNGGGHFMRAIEEERIGRDERLAWNAVVAVIDNALSKVSELAGLDSFFVHVALD